MGWKVVLFFWIVFSWEVKLWKEIKFIWSKVKYFWLIFICVIDWDMRLDGNIFYLLWWFKEF